MYYALALNLISDIGFREYSEQIILHKKWDNIS